MPRAISYALADVAGAILFALKRQDRQGILANLRRIFAYNDQTVSDRQLRRMGCAVAQNFCRHIVDFFSMRTWTRDEFERQVDFANIAVVERTLQEGHGVIVATAHLGDWELAARVLLHLGIKTNAVALSQSTEEMNNLFQGQRTGIGVNVIPLERAARGCLEALRRKEVVAILADRDFTPSRHLTKFFGKEARLPRGPAWLSVATGAPVIVGGCARLEDGRFRVFCGEAHWPEQGKDAETKIADAIAHDLEKFISKWPTQWCVFHDFWDIERDWEVAMSATKKGRELLRERKMTTSASPEENHSG